MDALVLIDVQKGFSNEDLGKRNNPNAEENMLKILEKFRKEKKKIIHIQHFSCEEGIFNRVENTEFKKGFEPLDGEIIFQKKVNSAFIGTDLEKYLKENEITDIVIIGLTLLHCVSTTVRMASNLGFKVILIEDATASFEMKDYYTDRILTAEEVHRFNITVLNGEFAKIIKTEDFLKKY